MRIDGTYRPQDPTLVSKGEPTDTAKAGKKGKAVSAGVDSSVEASAIGEDSLSVYAAKAARTPDVRSDAVAEARRLLEAGELDTPEALTRAAEAIVDQGV